MRRCGAKPLLSARLLPWLITLLLVIFLIRQGPSLSDLHRVIVQAQWFWLLLAVLFQAGAYGAITWLNELLLSQYRVLVPWLRQYLIQLIMAFIEAAIPSMAISGLVLRARLLKPYGATADVASVTTVVETVLISASVIFPAFVGLGWMLLHGIGDRRIEWTVLLWGIGFLGGGAVLIWQWRSARLKAIQRRWVFGLGSWWDQYLLSRFPDRLGQWPSARWIARARYLMAEMTILLRTRPIAIVSALCLRTASEALGFIGCFYAFGQRLPPYTLLLLYTLTITINTLGAIPGGVGLAEVSLATLYAQFDVELERAMIIALAYRLTGYWLPRAVGGLSWLWLERLHRAPLASEGPADGNRQPG
ncbi:MAG: lysylphosphatidylglycerol synthase transmembrane domain-containing protein [Anaerolineae bacterium]|nr:flippase-like domain-containing protein [Anaerolineae bacterium]MDW8098785.1 lysylphosphatidylglycerol synthase transmembrane domain-containing protein [Anaerolineae bacterium]